MTSKQSLTRWRFLPWLITLIIIVGVLKLVPYPFHASGEFRVTPAQRAEVRAVIEGLIESVTVQEGDRIEKDSVIATVSTRTIQRDLDLAQASLRRNSEILSQLESGPRPEEVAVAVQSLQLAETSLRHSDQALARAGELHAKLHLSDQEFEKVERERDIDFETVELAKKSLALEQAGVTESIVEAQRAEVERYQVEVRYLEEEVARTVHRAPISGRVTTLYFQDQIGRRVLPGDVIANIEDMETVLVRIAVPEQLMAGVVTGAVVRARSWADTSHVFKGRVTAILPIAVTRNEDLLQQAEAEQQGGMNLAGASSDLRVVLVLAEIEVGEHKLISGLTGYAKIKAGYRSLGYALFHPIIRFVRIQVWSWLP